MSFVLDSSAVLATLLNERGGDFVYDNMYGAHISVVNLSEVYQNFIEGGMEEKEADEIVGALPLRIRAFREAHALKVAALRPVTKHLGLSLGDRACLAQAMFSDLPILTADRDWAKLDLGLDIRQIRE